MRTLSSVAHGGHGQQSQLWQQQCVTFGQNRVLFFLELWFLSCVNFLKSFSSKRTKYSPYDSLFNLESLSVPGLVKVYWSVPAQVRTVSAKPVPCACMFFRGELTPVSVWEQKAILWALSQIRQSQGYWQGQSHRYRKLTVQGEYGEHSPARERLIG